MTVKQQRKIVKQAEEEALIERLKEDCPWLFANPVGKKKMLIDEAKKQ